MATHHAALPKPRWRGRLHGFAFFASIPQGVALVALGANWVTRLSTIVYALSLTGLYGVSAAYHRLRWTPRALARMRKLDHSMIYVLIAGTYTPFSLIVLEGAWATALLATIWAGAGAGVALKVWGFDRLRRIGGALYIVLGWLAVLAAPRFVDTLPAVVLALIAVGGVLYTLGAVVLLRRRPDPIPSVFGYHEVWHVMVVAASACHYAAIVYLVVSGSRTGA